METIFLISAITGGTLMVCLLVAGLMGIGAEHDTDTDHDTETDHGDGHGNAFFGMLSVRTLTAALLFFGLGGMTALYYGATEISAFAAAAAASVLTFYLTATAMNAMKQLKADGTVRIDRSVGLTGTVYLRVPGAKSGAGKVHIMLQNRTVEYQAMTNGDEISTGKPVKVLAVINSDTVEVEAV